jgi:hypothetical protein
VAKLSADALETVTIALTGPRAGLTMPKSTSPGSAANARFGFGPPGMPRTT